MKFFFSVILLLSFCLNAASGWHERQYLCFKLPQAPEIDGKLDDDCWQYISMDSRFQLIGGGLAPVQTQIKLGYFKDKLYVAVKCLEPDSDIFARKPYEFLPLNESVEISLAQPDDSSYFAWVIDSSGSQQCFGRAGQKIEAKVFKGEGFWNVEAVIALSRLGKIPQHGKILSFNIDRNRYCPGKPAENSAYSIIRGGKAYFLGELLFLNVQNTLQTAARREKLNQIKSVFITSEDSIYRLMGLMNAQLFAIPCQLKTKSVLFPPRKLENALKNAKKYAWAQKIRQDCVNRVKKWDKFTDDQLWELIFSPDIPRRWKVGKPAPCPECGKVLSMYQWQYKPFEHPWKVICPHCKAKFPKNDFAKFYRSGLDNNGIFRYALADRKLLYNAQYSNPKDGKHNLLVDDGHGCDWNGHHYDFIGYYLKGHYIMLIHRGIRDLAAAYSVSADSRYARRTAIMLDRLADLFPSYDLRTQGKMVGSNRGNFGYVTPWHDENLYLTNYIIAYDKIFDAIKNDRYLVDFLSKKARKYHLKNPKDSFAKIQHNIETNLFRQLFRQKNLVKVRTNFPGQQKLLALIKLILDYPQSANTVCSYIKEVIKLNTCCDNVTPEQGLSGYNYFATMKLADLLRYFMDFEDRRFKELCNMDSVIANSLFHVKTRCLDDYFPRIGDTGSFMQKSLWIGIRTNAYSVRQCYSFYKKTNNPVFLKLIYLKCNGDLSNPIKDIFAAANENEQLVKELKKLQKPVIIERKSIHFPQWHLGILRSGSLENRRVLWLDYDTSIGSHGHDDAMNIGLFAYGLDLLPDFGYPDTSKGWLNDKALWYNSREAHNSVVVSNAEGFCRPAPDAFEKPLLWYPRASGKMTYWKPNGICKVMQASGAKLINGRKFQRTVALVDISEKDSYVIDIFKVIGGTKHDKFQHATCGKSSTALNFVKTQKYGKTSWVRGNPDALMRNMQICSKSPTQWQALWEVNDIYSYLPPDKKVFLKYTNLTKDAGVIKAQSYVNLKGSRLSGMGESWIDTYIIRRTGPEPLESCFSSIIEPYTHEPNIADIKKLAVYSKENKPIDNDMGVALLITLKDGRKDLFVCMDENFSGEYLIKDLSLKSIEKIFFKRYEK